MSSFPWPYHFLSLTREQVAERRDLLTQRGIYTQLSALVILATLGVYRQARKHAAKREQPRPRGKRTWIDSPPVKGWSETRKQYLIAAGWVVWIVGLAFWKTGDDYLHLTKSLGHIALAQIPLQVLLSPKFLAVPNNRQLIPNFLDISQSSLTPYHRLLGRVVILPLLILHSILYLSFFALKTDGDDVPLLASRVQDLDVQLGILGLLTVLGLWITSSTVVLGLGLRGLRRWVDRKTFFYVHVGIVVGLLGVGFFHVVTARLFVIEVLVVWGVDAGVVMWQGEADGK